MRALVPSVPLLLAVTLALAACGSPSAQPEPDVTPLSVSPGATSSDPAGSGPTTSPALTAPATSAPPHGGRTDAPGSGDPSLPSPELRAQVEAALERYDRILTVLSAAPLPVPTDEQLLEWHAVVQPDSVLSADVLGRIAASAGTTHVRPAADGWSYRHRPLGVHAGSEGLIGFTWCGYSAGVRVATSDGAVVDAGVGFAHGVGELRDDGDGAGWRLASLDEMDLVVLAPGTPDPCPAEQQAAGGTG